MDDGLAFSWAHLNRKAREAVGAATRRINGSDIAPIFENMRDALAFVRGLNSQFAQDESIRMIESEVEKLNEGHRRLGEPRVLHFEPECPDLSQRPAFWWGLESCPEVFELWRECDDFASALAFIREANELRDECLVDHRDGEGG
jgi:hypothetical protein